MIVWHHLRKQLYSRTAKISGSDPQLDVFGFVDHSATWLESTGPRFTSLNCKIDCVILLCFKISELQAL